MLRSMEKRSRAKVQRTQRRRTFGTKYSLSYAPLAALVAVLVGGLVGGVAALGPLYAIAGIGVLVVGYILLTSTNLGLAMVFACITLLPFGTLPFKAIITPNFLTLVLIAVFMVWVLRILARSDSYDVRVSMLGLPIFGFLGFTFFSLILGARGLPDSATLHNYVKFIMGVLLFFTIINCVRTPAQARFVMRSLIICGGLAALVGLGLYMANDDLALSLLKQLGRIGYPTSGRVLRYVEDDPDGLERAIGTSVDPNSFGGMLALVVALSAAQLFTTNPVLPRWLLITISTLLGIVLLLTFSRAALLGVIIAAMYVATVRYRRLWWVMIIASVLATALLTGLGMAEDFIQRLVQGLQFQDQAQQMRLAEYQNALNIIQRYPFFGIGFGKAPEIDLVAGVSSIYLTIAERMGLIGLTAFLSIVGAWFISSWKAMKRVDEERAAWLLGTQAGVVAALAVGLADHYFFNIEFSHMVALFWGCIGLGTAVQHMPLLPNTSGASQESSETA